MGKVGPIPDSIPTLIDVVIGLTGSKINEQILIVPMSQSLNARDLSSRNPLALSK